MDVRERKGGNRNSTSTENFPGRRVTRLLQNPRRPPSRPRQKMKGASKKGTPNFCWTHVMTRFLVTFLVEQAKAGLKIGKTFKRPAFTSAAKAISEKFNVVVTESHVENRMRTLKSRFAQIHRLREMSDAEWDEDEKKIIMDPTRYSEHVVANPKDEPFINKPIDFYDEMTILCGNYQVTKGFSKCITDEIGGDIVLMTGDNATPMMNAFDGPEDNNNNMESAQPTPAKGASSSTSMGRTRPRGRKRKYGEHDNKFQVIRQLASTIGELAAAIRNSRGREIANDLYKEVMKCEGYSEDSLELAFDYLMENEIQARSFMAKSESRRQAWLSRFLSSRHE